MVGKFVCKTKSMKTVKGKVFHFWHFHFREGSKSVINRVSFVLQWVVCIVDLPPGNKAAMSGWQNKRKFFRRICMKKGTLLFLSINMVAVTSAAVVGSLTSNKRKWVLFLFIMPWRQQICIAKCLYNGRDDLLKNLFKTTAQDCKKCTAGCCASLKNVVVLP